MGKPGNILDKTFSREGCVSLVQTLIVLFTFLSWHHKLKPALIFEQSLLPSCMSVPFKARNRHSKHAQCPELAGDRDLQSNLLNTRPLTSCSLISLPRTIFPSLSITVPFLLDVRHHSGTAPIGAEPTASGVVRKTQPNSSSREA